MKTGIVGLPNAGKSTLFNAFMREAIAHAANYPFCTIEPNAGRVPVGDDRLQELAKIIKPQKIIEAVLECVDIAGLIKGASTGAGMGNSFLSNIRNVDLILQVVRAFNDPDTGAEPTPIDDAEVLEQELILSDIQILEKYAEKNKRDKCIVDFTKRALEILNQGLRLAQHEFDVEDFLHFKQIGMLTSKPHIYVCNVNEEDLLEIPDSVAKLQEKGEVITCCATYEYDLSQQKEAGVEDMAELQSRIPKIIRAAYDKLGLISFFTAGEKEVRAWKTRRDSYAPQAAGVIHTDFEEKFIKADVVSCEDFVSCGGWEESRRAGKVRTEGKKYIMQDGDVCLFKI